MKEDKIKKDNKSSNRKYVIKGSDGKLRKTISLVEIITEAYKKKYHVDEKDLKDDTLLQSDILRARKRLSEMFNFCKFTDNDIEDFKERAGSKSAYMFPEEDKNFILYIVYRRKDIFDKIIKHKFAGKYQYFLMKNLYGLFEHMGYEEEFINDKLHNLCDYFFCEFQFENKIKIDKLIKEYEERVYTEGLGKYEILRLHEYIHKKNADLLYSIRKEAARLAKNRKLGIRD